METPGFLLFDFSAENGLEAISVNYYYYIHGEKIWIKILVGFFSSNKSGLINEKKRKKYNSNYYYSGRIRFALVFVSKIYRGFISR